MFGSSGNKTFEKLAEKATSPLQLDVDWNSILQMCDVIRQGDVQPKYAIGYLKKKLTNENINVVNYTLHCIESLVKNCGSKIQQEVANREFMDIMKGLAVNKPDPVKTKVLELIQCWAYAFRKNPNYKVVEDYFNVMKVEGFQYPPFKESDSMFDVEQAPEWKDDTNCFRCRAEFSTFNRKHHCRCCGQIFCNACSSKTSAIPKFGIEKEVRVCDLCFDKLKTNPSAIGGTGKESQDGLPIEYLSSPLSKQKQVPSKQEKTDEEFEEELQLALALSQSEQEEKDKKRSTQNNTKLLKPLTPAVTTNGSTNNAVDDSESELNKFLARSAAKKVATSEPAKLQQISGPSPPPSAPYVEAKLSDEKAQEHNDETTQQMNLFIEELKKFMEIFITRMKSDQQRGRTITNDTAVQSLFLQLQQCHPKLLAFVKFQEDARAYYESLQDKLTQLKDAREALNALRYENFEKKRREAEERERLKQLQLNSKLADMRQKKHLYFKLQTEQNLKRLQEQEHELQLRLEQQRLLVSMRDQQLVSGLQFPLNQNQMQNPYEQQYNNPMYSMLQQQQAYQQQLPTSLSANNFGANSNIPNPNASMNGSYSTLQMPSNQPQQQLNSITPSMLPIQNQQINQPFINQQQNPYNMNAMGMSLPQLPQTNLNIPMKQNTEQLNQVPTQQTQFPNQPTMIPPTQLPQQQWQQGPVNSLIPPPTKQQQQQPNSLTQTILTQPQLPQTVQMQPPLQQYQMPTPMMPQQIIPNAQQQFNTQLNQIQPQQYVQPLKPQNEDVQLISFD